MKVNASILIIGNEILSGRTQDTNTSTIATWLNSIGVKVKEVRVIPDIENTIIETLNVLRKKSDLLINFFCFTDPKSINIIFFFKNFNLYKIGKFLTPK